MDSVIAFCGISCFDCEVFQAACSGDPTWEERVAAVWLETYPSSSIETGFACDGCRAVGGRQSPYCQSCDIRTCALQRDMQTCADCPQFEACPRLAKLFLLAPGVRSGLEEIRNFR